MLMPKVPFNLHCFTNLKHATHLPQCTKNLQAQTQDAKCKTTTHLQTQKQSVKPKVQNEKQTKLSKTTTFF
jgi:hypothetical protein